MSDPTDDDDDDDDISDYESSVYFLEKLVACVAWRFWLLSNKGGRCLFVNTAMTEIVQ